MTVASAIEGEPIIASPPAAPVPEAIDMSMSRRVLILVFLAWIFDAADSTIYSLTLPLIREEFGLQLSTMGTIASLFIGGTFLGSLLLPMLAEKKGRRIGMVTCISIFSVATGLMGLASNAILVTLSRVFTGVGGGAQWPIGAAYLSEMVPAKRRGLAMTFMQAGYPVGYFLAGGIFAAMTAMGYGWRACYVLLAVPILLCIPIMTMLRESPTWLKHRQEGLVPSVVTGKTVSLRDRYRLLFAPQYLKYTLIATGLHVFGAIYSYGLVVWVPSAIMTDFHISKIATAQFVMVAWGVATFGYLAAGWLADRIGRRIVLTLYTLLGLGAVAYLNVLHGQAEVTLSQLLLPGCLIGCSLGVSGIYIAYTSEIYPSKLRTVGLGFSVAIGKQMAFFVPAVLGFIAQQTSVTTALLVSSGLGFLMIPIVFCGPETAGRSLDEIVK